MRFQVVVETSGNKKLPPSPPMDKGEAEAAIATIREAIKDGRDLELPWLAIDSRLVESAALTPAKPSRPGGLN